MSTEELIAMLQVIHDSAEPIQTPESGCGFSTLVLDIKEDSFKWVIEEAINELKGDRE